MKNFFRKCSKSNNPLIRRYAGLLSTKSIDSDFFFKEVDNESIFDFTVRKIMNAIPELANYEDCFFLDSVLMDIYNKKNKVYISKAGLIRELSECSKILNANLRKEKHIFAVDIITLEYSLRRDGKTEKEISSIIKKLRKLLSPEIEQEKKYIFNDNSKDPLGEFKQVQGILDLHDGSYKENDDQYYDLLGILNSEHINLRQRNSEDMEWTLKRPVKDSSSISKRDEKTFLQKTKL
ncbi:MAG: hypothetical protein HFG33_02255 [Bacilli bacterium]|nr:hypothetical protein [Bacilli bacterium]